MRNVWIAFLVVVLAGCGGKKSPSAVGADAGVAGAAKVARRASTTDVASQGTGLRYRLSHGEGAGAAADRPPAAAGEALDETRLGAMLARLPALAPQTGDEKAFAMREGSDGAPFVIDVPAAAAVGC